MAVSSINTASLNKLFLEFIKPGLEKEFYINTTFYDRFKTDVESCLGKYGVMKLLTASPKSARPSSTSTFPTAKAGAYTEFVFYMKRGMYATLQFDGLAIACGKGAGAVKDLVKTETEAIMLYIPHRLNKQFWGDGSGRLAQTEAAVSNSVTCLVDKGGLAMFGVSADEYSNAAQYLAEGQSVDIYSSAGVLEAEDVEISTIVDDGDGTATLTLASAVTCSADSLILDHDTYAATEAAGTGVPMGITGIVSTANPYVGITATSAFQGINRSTYTWAQAQAFAMGGSATVLTGKKMVEVLHKIERYGTCDVVITNPMIWRNIYDILEADKVISNDPSFWLGVKGLTFYGGKSKGLPIIWDEDCRDEYIYFLDSSKIKVVAPEKNGMNWIPGDSGSVMYRVQGKDEYACNLRWYYNMTCSMPKAEGYLYNVKHASS